jgi:hypothetical protein
VLPNCLLRGDIADVLQKQAPALLPSTWQETPEIQMIFILLMML